MNVDNKLIRLAVDSYHGRMTEHSVEDSQEVLRKALIEANGGSAVMNYKDIRDGKCNGMFAIVETLIQKISEEGLKGDEVFTQFIEDRNKALGDSDRFHVVKPCLFYVADIAEGSQSVRAQRLEAGQDITLHTKPRAVNIYEELNRVLSGRVNFNDFVDAVGRSFTQADLDEAYAIWANMMTTERAPYVVSGSYDEDALLDVIQHVEAATGETATIVGTKKALRKIKLDPDTLSAGGKEDLYAMGYFGRFNGTQMIQMKQRHKIGTTDFILPDNTVYILAGSTKPIKRVTEGDVTMMTGNPMDNADLHQEFLTIKRTGIGIVMDREFGAYTMS